MGDFAGENDDPSRVMIGGRSVGKSWLRANQSFLLLFNDVCLTEKQQIPILVFGLCSNSWDTALDKHANNYTTNAVIQYLKGEMKTKSKAKAV